MTALLRKFVTGLALAKWQPRHRQSDQTPTVSPTKDPPAALSGDLSAAVKQAGGKRPLDVLATAHLGEYLFALFSSIDGLLSV
jgi:hypothetical protein